MTDAPERIWAFEDYPGSGAVPRGGMWCDEQSECPEDTPAYIRADLVEALEAENQRLRASLRECLAIVDRVSDKRAYRALKTRARAILNSTEGSHDD